MSSMRILVVGGAGYIGSELCEQLQRQRRDFLILDSFERSTTSAAACQQRGWRYVQCDVRDDLAVASEMHAYKPTHIIHLAAIHYIPECEANPDLTISTNIHGLSAVIHAAKALRTTPKFVFLSSAAIYDGHSEHCTEAQAARPTDLYGLTKYTGELMVRQHLQKYVIARLFNVYGKHDPYAHLIPKLHVELMRQNTSIQLGSRKSKRDYVHVSDVATALCGLLCYEGQTKVFNVGSSEAYSVEQVVNMMAEKFNTPVQPIFMEKAHLRLHDKPLLRADISKIKTELNWQPAYKLEEGLATLC